MKHLFCSLLLSVLVLQWVSAQEYTLNLLEEVPLKKIPEPSGLSYAEERNSLFLVGDEGHIAEISLEGEILSSAWLGKRDLEGVAWGLESETLFVLDERLNRLILLDADDFSIIQEAGIPEAGPYEGLCTDHQGSLFLVNQKRGKKAEKAGILEITPGGTLHHIRTGIKDQSALLLYKGHFYILSDTENRLYCLDRTGGIIWSCKVPGKNQEGLAVDAEGIFYIAQDSGGVTKLELVIKDEKDE
ncbi:MAG: SdiA-regulated domain-containing protein [Spirochaetales bacterium]|nr:SdiA-regulated domain-containing protein [Spirochaetales bacterium]